MRWVLFLLAPLWGVAGEWAEGVLAKMSLDEKIGQLFMAPFCPMRGEDHRSDWERLLRECHVGNAILKQADPESQIGGLRRLQGMSRWPLLAAADAEWGLAMRMKGTMGFPKQMTLGAVQDLGLIEKMGREIGRQARIVGIHINLAPVADVNVNSQNPVIGMRSFGDDPERVAERVVAYAKGLQAEGILACAKHFPGHGDTSVDSHFGLPILPFFLERLEAMELPPFRKAVEAGVAAVMSAHVLAPSLDLALPASLSESCLQGLLREGMGFRGLIVSDALNMGAIADRFSPEEAACLAKKASCDLLLYGTHIDEKLDEILRVQIPRAFAALKRAYKTGELEMRGLDESVLRILEAKEKIDPLFAAGSLQTEEAMALKKRLFQEAVTLLGEKPSLQKSAIYVSLGKGDAMGSLFERRFSISLEENLDPFWETLERSGQIVLALHEANPKAPRFGLSERLFEQIRALSKKTIVCLFTTPYSLSLFEGTKTILVGYENDPDAQSALLEALKGDREAPGRLPIKNPFSLVGEPQSNGGSDPARS